ncbi:MAG TPA: FAD:protein FMN transferase [Gemmataceae bacterium]|nr:FAD:protein FMN transferase [Gemmataceae bacterium]
MLTATLLALLLAPGPKLERFTYTEPHMGTRFKIILYAPDRATADRAAKDAFQRVAELDGIMSDYRPASELMQLCKKAGGGPVHVSDDLFFVLSRAQELSRRSGGAFDVTVGPVVRLWRRARQTKQLPDPEELKRALALVGFDKMKLDARAHTVRLTKPGMQLDLGGIAKGYAADEALKVLRKHGVTRALVAASGDIAVSGPPPGKDGWTVGIAPLLDPDAEPKRYLVLKNAAVSTSGDAEQYVEIGGKRYSHIVNPSTGIGLVGRLSATVVAPDGITADSNTKVVAVLGPEKGFPIIEQTPGVSGFFVRQTDRGEEEVASPRFRTVPQKADRGK